MRGGTDDARVGRAEEPDATRDLFYERSEYRTSFLDRHLNKPYSLLVLSPP